MRNILISLVLFTCIVHNDAQAQESSTVEGRVISGLDSVPVPFAHIINWKMLKATTTDEKGFFSIHASFSDSIVITAIGFESKSFIAANNLPEIIFLQPSLQELDTVHVSPLPPKALFPAAFLHLQLPEENGINLHLPDNVMKLNLVLVPEDIKVKAPNEISSAGVVMTFGSVPKIQNKESQFEQHKKMFEEIERKYGHDFIAQLTGVLDDEQISAIKKFCNLSNEYILKTSEYDIALAVMNCFKEMEKRGLILKD